jgi:hypothetical protein
MNAWLRISFRVEAAVAGVVDLLEDHAVQIPG